MCAVIAFTGHASERVVKRLDALLMQSKIRGLHAFGVAHSAPHNAIVCNKFLTLEEAREYLREHMLWSIPAHVRVIAHCRYSTSGDWHSAEANQPLVIDDLAMCFNGVIRMTTRDQWSKEFGFEPQTDNDGEIFMRKVLDGEDWETWVARGPFSFAGVMLYRGELLALRNRQRPLYHVRDGRSHYIGSTANIFHRAGFKVPPHPIQPGVTLRVG